MRLQSRDFYRHHVSAARRGPDLELRTILGREEQHPALELLVNFQRHLEVSVRYVGAMQPHLRALLEIESLQFLASDHRLTTGSRAADFDLREHGKVHPHLVQDDLWGRVVSLRLRLFLAFLVRDVSKDDAGFVRVRPRARLHSMSSRRFLVEQKRAPHEQGVKPAPRLIDRLADEIGWEGSFELLQGAGEMRKSPLREGHAPGIKPSVDHFGYSNEPTRRTRALVGHFVDPRLVDDEMLGRGSLALPT